jgi:hypothetical protein
MEVEYIQSLNEKTNVNNRIRKQQLNTWHSLKIDVPPQHQRQIIIDYLGPKHTGGWYEEKPKRVTITLMDLTVRQAKKLILKYGSSQQKKEVDSA